MCATRIVYLTWGSTPRTNSVFGTQVLAQLTANAKAMPEAEFTLLAGVPLANAGLLREGMGFFRQLRQIGQQLAPVGFETLPIYAPQTVFNATRRSFGFMHYGSQWHLARSLRRIAPDIVHCRSYHAAWAALQVRKRLKASYRIIFDARGLWPEEVALKHGSRESPADFAFRKEIEAKLLAECEVTVSVSQPMADQYLAIGVKRSEVIHLSASVARLTAEYAGDLSRPTLIYVGGLANDTWHRPANLVALYDKFRSTLGKTRLIVVTTSNHAAVRAAFAHLPEDEFTLTRTQTIEELSGWLAQADFGALSYFSPESPMEMLLSSTVLAVKTAEYLAAGLPMLINETCAGAAHFVRSHNVGIPYGADHSEITEHALRALMTPETRAAAQKLATAEFDFAANGARYATLYRSLLNDGAA